MHALRNRGRSSAVTGWLSFSSGRGTMWGRVSLWTSAAAWTGHFNVREILARAA